MPSPDFIRQSLEREAVRRIFWLIHLLDVMASIYFKKPTTFTPSDLRLRLPVDETSFEMGVHSTLPGERRFPVLSRSSTFPNRVLPSLGSAGCNMEPLDGTLTARRHHRLFVIAAWQSTTHGLGGAVQNSFSSFSIYPRPSIGL